MRSIAPTLTFSAVQWTPMLQRLTWVIAGLALCTLPHFTHLSPWIVALATAAAALRITIEIKRWQLPPKWLRTVVAFAALLGVLLTYRTINGIEAGTGLLVVMSGMKLLETRSVRDLTVIVFLCYFALFAAFLYNQDLIRLPYLLITAWLLTVTLLRIHQTTSAMKITEAASLTSKMFLQALPLAVLLFLFMPRLPGQFWTIPALSRNVTGLDDEMSPGDVSDLSLSDEIAFRVTFEGELPPARERYWRGPVLHDFDGRTWRRLQTLFREQTLSISGPTYRYRQTLEAHQQQFVFPLDIVTQWQGRPARRTADFQLLTYRPISTMTSFDLQSATQYKVEGDLPRGMQAADTRLPEGRNPRSIELAREMRSKAGSDEAYVRAVLSMFSQAQYYYTLQPPRLQRDSVDDFLFNARRGFCEHYASAFTVLMRAAGIPARVVTGYQGGEFNPMGGYLIVRQSDAHAWSEVWLDGRGWVRIDPTAAIAPSRIESGLDAAMGDDEPVPGRLIRNINVLSQMRLAWDAANTFWNNEVVEFGEKQQRWLMQRFNVENASWRQLAIALGVALVLFFATLTAYLAWRFRPRSRDPVARVYDQLCRRLARLGMPRLPHEGPIDYVARVAGVRPDLAAQLAEARNLYVSLRYGPSPLSSQLSRLKFLVNQLNARATPALPSHQ